MSDENKSKYKDIVERAQKRYKTCEDAESESREEALKDFRMAILSEQWDDQELNDRAGRPSLTINRLAQYVSQVCNEQRQAKTSIKIIGVDDQSDRDVAEIQSGLIRNIEYLSRADLAFDTAFEHAVVGGFGFVGVLTQYADDDTFDQDIRIRCFDNCFAVHLDPYHTLPDGSDAEYAFVTDKISKDEFEAKYPGKEYTSDGVADDYKDAWEDKDSYYVREYWERERVHVTLQLCSDGVTRKKGDVLPAGIEVVRERPTTTHKVKCYIIAGDQVLEESEFPARYIPIVPVYGKRTNVAGRIMVRGLVRLARDAQRMFNYWRSSIAEKVAMAPKTPFILTASQVENYEQMWANANNKPLPYLLINDTQNPVPQRADVNDLSQGLLAANAQAEDDIKATIGIYDPQLGVNTGQSGRAILALQKQGDTSTYGFQDNLSRARAQVGRIILDLIPKVYDTQRIVRVLGIDGESDLAEINKKVPNAVGGWDVLNDVTVGKYDVEVSTGPSYATKRLEAADSMIQFVQAYPAAAPVIGPLLAKNLDWPDAEKVAEGLVMLLPPEMRGIFQTEEDDNGQARMAQLEQALQVTQQQAMQMVEKVQQDAQAAVAQAENKSQVEMAKIQLEMEKLEIERHKLGLDVQKTQADVEAMRVKAQTDYITAEAQAAKDMAEAEKARLESAVLLNEKITSIDEIRADFMSRLAEMQAMAEQAAAGRESQVIAMMQAMMDQKSAEMEAVDPEDAREAAVQEAIIAGQAQMQATLGAILEKLAAKKTIKYDENGNIIGVE